MTIGGPHEMGPGMASPPVVPYHMGQPVHPGYAYGNRSAPSPHMTTGMANGATSVPNPNYMNKMAAPGPKPFPPSQPFTNPSVPNPNPTNPLLRVGGEVGPNPSNPRMFNWMNNGTKPNPSVKQ